MLVAEDARKARVWHFTDAHRHRMNALRELADWTDAMVDEYYYSSSEDGDGGRGDESESSSSEDDQRERRRDEESDGSGDSGTEAADRMARELGRGVFADDDWGTFVDPWMYPVHLE